MATTGTHRTTTVFLALLVGIALGWFLERSSTGPAPQPKPTPLPVAATPTCVPIGPAGNKTVVVGPTAAEVYPECLSMASTDTVTWNATNSTSNLNIEFDERLFANMTQVGTRWRVNNSSSSTCNSGAVAPSYPKPTEKKYKYHQILNGTDADGRIIIQW